MRSLFIYLFLFFIQAVLFLSCVPLEPTGSSSGSRSQARLEMADREYLPSIHTAQLYPNTQQEAASLEPAAVSVNQGVPLLLTFDDLRPDFEQFQVRIVHCNWNWQPSNLSSMQYLYEFNEFPVSEYDFSQNTRIPYVHYRFQLPKVKIPGNYVAVVFRNNNPADLVLSRRFMIYDNRARINADMRLPAGPVERRENQQIDFTLHYGSVPNVVDPASQFKVVIRKNQRWDNAIFGLKPSGIREGLQELTYEPFDKSNQFKAGNEYRFFDLRMVQARGQNVGRVMRDSTGVQAFLVPNLPRTGEGYAQIQDLNGQFQITNVEWPQPSISSEYVDVHFFLKTEGPRPEPVYVAGAFSQYLPEKPYLMRYDAEAGGYLADILLKQGWYNYLFLVQDPDNRYALEGSHSETENDYEIIIYYRPVGQIHDIIIGYTELSSRRR